RRLAAVLTGEGVLELMLGQRGWIVVLAEVSPRRQVEVRLTLLVLCQPRVRDLPAHGRAVLESAERVPDGGRVGPVAPEGAELLAPVGVAKAQPVAGRREVDAALLHLRDEPVAALEVDDLARLELRLARVRVLALPAEAVDVDELVVNGHSGRL